MGIVNRKMMREVAQRRFAICVEPSFDACEVPAAGGVRQIIGQRPDPQQQRKQMSLHIGECEFNGLRWRRNAAVKQSRIETKKRGNESSAIVKHRYFDQPYLEFHLFLRRQPRFAPQSLN